MEIKRTSQIIITGTDEELDAVEKAVSAIGSLIADDVTETVEGVDPASVNAIFNG